MDDRIFHMVGDAPAPVAPYSHAVEVDGWLFVTGQLPIDPADNDAPLPSGIENQTRTIFHNLEIVLGHAGYALTDVVSARVFLTDFRRDYAAMNAVYASYFSAE